MADTNNTPPTLGPKAGKTIGQSGTSLTNGIISLEEYNRKLVGKSALNQYDIMRRSDSTIRAVLQVCMLPLLSASWDIQPAHIDKDDPELDAKQKQAEYKARFIKRELFNRNINFSALLKSLLSALPFGFDVEEKTYEKTEFEGQFRIGIGKIDKRKQTTILSWVTDDLISPGITQYLPKGETVYIPMDKLIVFTHDKEGDNYEGISLLRYVYKDWDIKDKLTIVNAIALEKMAVGVPVIAERENTTASEPDKQKAIESMQNFRANESGYLMMPSTLEVAMLDMKYSTTKDVIPTLNYCDSRISKSILAGFLEIGGHSGSGSQALAKDLTSLFMKSEEALANLIIATLSDQLVKQLCDFNFTDMSEGYPELTVSNLADDDIAAISAAVAALTTSGALTPDATMEDHIRDIMGMPELPEDMKENYQDFRPAKPAAPQDAPISDKDKKTLKTDPKSKDAKKAAAIAQIQAARRTLIEVDFQD